MLAARLRGWPSQPLRAVATWNADLAQLDADRQTSIRRRALDLSVLAALGLGLVALVLWMARWQTLAAHPHAFAAGLLAQLALYGAAAGWVCWRKPPARWALALVVLLALGARLAYVPQTPSASDDIYRYVWDGRVQAQGINPYRYAPDDPALTPLRDDAIYPHINRKPAHTIYPPAAQAVFRGLYALHPNSVTWTKLAFSLIDLVTIALIAGLLMRLGLRPERVLLYAWHPLLILEIAHSGHLDGVLLCVLALAIRARLQGHAMRTGALLAGAALLKFYALAALPALLFGERRKDARALGALSLTALLAYLPFLSVGAGIFGYLGGYTREEGIDSGGRFYLLGRARQLLEATPGVTWLFGGLPVSDARLYQSSVLLTLAALALWCWRAPRVEPRHGHDPNGAAVRHTAGADNARLPVVHAAAAGVRACATRPAAAAGADDRQPGRSALSSVVVARPAALAARPGLRRRGTQPGGCGSLDADCEAGAWLAARPALTAVADRACQLRRSSADRPAGPARPRGG